MPADLFARLEVTNWRQFRAIAIDLHPRITIITGANGAGKSTILSFFARHFGYNRSLLATPLNKKGQTSFVMGIFNTIKKGMFGIKPINIPQGTQIGRIDYASGQHAAIRLPPNSSLNYNIGIDNQQPVEGIHIDSHRPPNIYRHVGQLGSSPPVLAGLGSGLNQEYMNYYSSGQVQYGSLHHIKMNLIQMSIFGYGNPTMDPLPELLSLYSGFEDKLRLMLPKSLGFKKLIIRSPEVLLSTLSGDFLIDAASGGVIKLIEIAWQLYFFSQDKERFVITFDEPENHLHPSMQKSFIPSIMSAFPNAQIIVVTHSPFIISAIQDSAVYVLRYEDAEVLSDDQDDDQSVQGLMGTKVVAERLDTINKAGSASEILREVLGITTTIPDWAEHKVSDVISRYKGTNLDDATLKQLYADLEREGLASSYPSAISSLTRVQ